MDDKKQELLNVIEAKRAEMNCLLAVLGEHPLSSAVIVKVSQELDLLLNQYQKLITRDENNIGKGEDNHV